MKARTLIEKGNLPSYILYMVHTVPFFLLPSLKEELFVYQVL
jgi:hypothetical protein